jgi:hypothetical protein
MAESAAAVASPPSAAPASAPSAAPSAAPAAPPSSSPSAAPATPPEGTPSAASPPAPEHPSLDLPTQPPPVPYAKFKAERARMNAQIAELRQQVEQRRAVEEQLAQARTQLEQQTQAAQHFQVLSRVIRQDPEMAAKIEALIGQLPDDPHERAATVAQLPPETQAALKAVEKLVARAEQQDRATASRAEQAEVEETRKELRSQYTSILEKRNLPAPAFLPLMEAYVLRRIAQMGDQADFDDVPYLAAEFLKPILQWHTDELARLGAGKREDGRLPASPESSPPIHSAPPAHALDATTTRMAEDFLKQRGWAA